ncbi:hypothetical protein [Rhodocaloribacter sp.]
MNPRTPFLLAAVLLLFAGNAGLSRSAGAQTTEPPEYRFRYVATVHQTGPVGYRDPLGVISPDGVWLAFAAGPKVGVQRIAGGPVTLFDRVHRITEIAWLPDSRRFAARDMTPDRKGHWLVYDLETGTHAPLWPDRSVLRGVSASGTGDGETFEAEAGRLRYLAWSPDGRRVAGVVPGPDGTQVWTLDADGGGARVRVSDQRLTYPAWVPGEDRVACLAFTGERQGFDAACAGLDPRAFGQEAYGPIAFSPEGDRLYYAVPDEHGALDLWRRDRPGGPPQRLTRFTRDTYAPSVARDGRVLFKTQDYRTSIATAPTDGGPSTAVTTFQAETPSWSRDGTAIAFTYGTWRHATDDFHYPDIAQNLGIVRMDGALPAGAPTTVVRASRSEDQGMDWSPNGKWIVLHSHADGLDDVWLLPADGSAPAHPITRGGVETGWPRWSPDGRWIVYATEVYEGQTHRTALFLIGIDQETGEVTEAAHEIPIGRSAEGTAVAVWSPDSERLVFEAETEPGRKGLFIVNREGGTPKLFHTFASDIKYSGVTVSPDFRWAAYVAPAPDGFLQVFRVPLSGGEARQVTFDPTNKTHPAWSPKGDRIAFTVFRYLSHFWLLTP